MVQCGTAFVDENAQRMGAQIPLQDGDESSDLTLLSGEEDMGGTNQQDLDYAVSTSALQQSSRLIQVETESSQDQSCIPIYGSSRAPTEGWESDNDADSERAQHPGSQRKTKLPRNQPQKIIKPSLNLAGRTPNCGNCATGIQAFLDQINTDTLSSACSVFEQAIGTHDSGFSTLQLSPKVYQQARNLLHTISNKPLEESAAIAILPFWALLGNLTNYSNFTAIDAILTGKRTAAIYHELHLWLGDVLDFARNFTPSDSTDVIPPWPIRLWNYIDAQILMYGNRGNKGSKLPMHAILLQSTTFLPSLGTPKTYELQCPPWVPVEHKDNVVADKVVDAIRTFLNFPTGPHAVFQHDFLKAIYKIDSTLLYLRPVWDAFCRPNDLLWTRCRLHQLES
ncbi:hypothetical protein BDN72DRAFT_865526, partial [Pluteus cervinus]